MMKRKSGHSPFTILNTDGSNFPGTHWWSILNIYPKKQLFVFDSYDFLCFKAFIEQDDGSVINKILYDTKKFNKKDNIVTLVTVTCSRKNFEKLSQNEFLKLSSITATYFTFNEFAELTRIKDEVILHFVDDQLQSKTSDTCGIFQLYFYKNLFHHSKKVKLLTTKN